jgi:thiosulfate/3-mercaptopyruvate sulfurtransferase
VIPPLVADTWLADRLAAAGSPGGRPVVVADVRWYLDGRSGLEAYRNGHLPGAVWIDLDRWLAAHLSPTDGRHPLPDPAVFAEGMSRNGIGPDTVVVAYDDQGGLVAGRLVWMLRRLGHDAALLDGGLGAWTGPVEQGDGPVPAATSFPIRPWPSEYFVTTDEVRDRPATTRLLDARAAERYRGETEPIDPQAGHIPGASSMPLTGNLGPDGRFLSVDQLVARYAPVLAPAADGTPVEEVVVYCGSGVSACHDLLALEATGHVGRLYTGSWSAWSSTPGLPVATGDQP